MNDIIQENLKYIVVFGIIYVITTIIILTIIWMPEKEAPEHAKYIEVNDKEVDAKASKLYIDKLIEMYEFKDSGSLYRVLDRSYKEYTRQYTQDIKKEVEKLDVTKIKVESVEKHYIKNTVIYSSEISFGKDKRSINIIENYPGDFTYTLGTFYKYIYKSKNYSKDGVGFFIKNIYQDLKYLEINLEVYNNSKESIIVKMESPTDVMLVLNDGKTISMNNLSIAKKDEMIKVGSKLKKQLIFNIPIGVQGQIEKIKFNNIIINNSQKALEFKIDL